jgi:hypothetical protein
VQPDSRQQAVRAAGFAVPIALLTGLLLMAIANRGPASARPTLVNYLVSVLNLDAPAASESVCDEFRSYVENPRWVADIEAMGSFDSYNILRGSQRVAAVVLYQPNGDAMQFGIRIDRSGEEPCLAIEPGQPLGVAEP